MISAALQVVWAAYMWVLTHAPFFAQPVTIFILVTDIGASIYESVDRISWGPFNRFKPLSLHPHVTTGKGDRIIAQYNAWGKWGPAVLWHSFPFVTYALVDALCGSQLLTFFRADGIHSAAAQSADLLPSALPVTFFVGASARDIAGYNAMPFPSTAKFVADFVILMLGFDAAMYFFHRILHLRAVYNAIHNAHHRVKFPYPATIYYVEMIDGLINFLSLSTPSLVSYYLLDMHPVTHVVFIALIAALGATAHSGYDVFFSATFHFCHHVLGDCNYGGLGVFDTLFGTYISIEQLKATHPAYAITTTSAHATAAAH